MPGVFLLAPGAVFQDPNAQSIHANATVTANGEAVVTGYGATEVTLFINVKAAPTGTSPTLQYTIREVDPGDGVTVIGPTATSSSITGVGIQKISLVATFGGSIVVSWTIGGTTPSFTQVYATMVGKDGSVALVDATGVAISSANPLRTDPTGSTTQPVSGTFWQTTQPVSGTVTANQGTQGTHAQRWMTGLSDGSGFISPATDRTTAAGPFSFRLSDGAAFYDAAKTGQLPTALVGGRLDVVVGAALPAGTNNIGDVDVLTVPAPLSTTGGGTEAAALRVTIANDSTGLVSVDDNGGSLTVDTPQLPAALVGGRLDANVGAWMGATTPTVGQKTMAASIPIVFASDQTPLPVSQSGTWTVQQGTPPWQVVGPGAAGAAVTGNPVIMGGSDGTLARYISVDTTGRLVIVQPTASLLNATVTQGPAAALAGYWPVRVTDGTNTLPTMDVAARSAFIRWTDGTNTAAVKAASTAAVATDPAGVVALSPNSPLPAGTNTLGKVDQGVAAALSGAWPVKVTDGTNTMPTGDVVARAIFEKITDGTNTAAVKAASTAAVVADPSLVVALSPNSPVPTGSNTIGALTGTAADNSANSTLKLPVLPARANAAAPTWTEGNQAPLSVLLAGQLRTDMSSWIGSTAPTVGQKAMASSVPVVLASDQTAINTKLNSSTGAVTQVASSVTNVTLLASNTARRGAIIYNDSNKTLFVKLGATASSTSYSKKLGTDECWEIPFGYTGQIDGIWNLANGNAYVTELT